MSWLRHSTSPLCVGPSPLLLPPRYHQLLRLEVVRVRVVLMLLVVVVVVLVVVLLLLLIVVVVVVELVAGGLPAQGAGNWTNICTAGQWPLRRKEGTRRRWRG